MTILFITGFLFQFAFTMFVSFFGVLLYKRFGFTQGTIGEYFAYAGLWIGITQIFITKWMAKRFTEVTVVRLGLIGCSIFSFILFFRIDQWVLYTVTALFAIANGLAQTSILSLVSTNAERGSHGKIMGINSSLYALANAIPPALSGAIAASDRVETPILVASLLIVGSTIMFFRYKAPHSN
jgi:DHA1 family tetracycline resistance protein-like MFS transporter